MTSGEPPRPSPSRVSQAPGLPFDRSVSGSSTCSSLASSSQESDDVFSDAEGKSVTAKKRSGVHPLECRSVGSGYEEPLTPSNVLLPEDAQQSLQAVLQSCCVATTERRVSPVAPGPHKILEDVFHHGPLVLAKTQLLGAAGRTRSEGGLILKKFSAVEAACLSELMTDVLRPFVPAYHGVAKVGEERYIQMDDLLLGLQNPSIMDCKMGTRTYLEDEVGKSHPRSAPRRDLYQKMVKIDPWAPTPEEHSQGAITKPRYMQWRENTSSSTSLGFRIEGVTKTYLARLENLRQALDKSNFFKRHETLPAPAHIHLRHNVAWTPGSHEDGYLIGLQHLAHTIQVTLARAEQSQEPVLGLS
ncbi:hypothetical protein Chor_014905 [Crotalus horridus]